MKFFITISLLFLGIADANTLVELNCQSTQGSRFQKCVAMCPTGSSVISGGCGYEINVLARSAGNPRYSSDLILWKSFGPTINGYECLADYPAAGFGVNSAVFTITSKAICQ